MNNQWLEVGKVYPTSFEEVLLYNHEGDSYALGYCIAQYDGEDEDNQTFLGFEWVIEKESFIPTHFQFLEPPLTIKVYE